MTADLASSGKDNLSLQENAGNCTFTPTCCPASRTKLGTHTDVDDLTQRIKWHHSLMCMRTVVNKSTQTYSARVTDYLYMSVITVYALQTSCTCPWLQRTRYRPAVHVRDYSARVTDQLYMSGPWLQCTRYRPAVHVRDFANFKSLSGTGGARKSFKLFQQVNLQQRRQPNWK